MKPSSRSGDPNVRLERLENDAAASRILQATIHHAGQLETEQARCKAIEREIDNVEARLRDLLTASDNEANVDDLTIAEARPEILSLVQKSLT